MEPSSLEPGQGLEPSQGIPLLHLGLFVSLVLLPAAILAWQQRRRSSFCSLPAAGGSQPLAAGLLIGVVRMVLQLAFIGFYLHYLFVWNKLWLNLSWVLVMLAIANAAILKGAGLQRRFLFWPCLPGLFSAVFAVGLLLLLSAGARPLYSARYLIPMFGMLLGNMLRGSIVALERFYAELRSGREGFELQLFNGASLHTAIVPYRNRALRAAIAPSIAEMATTGLVYIPGMMSGQILGGAAPLEAIKYQLLITVAIFLALFFAVLLALYLTLPVAFTPCGVLRDSIYRK